MRIFLALFLFFFACSLFFFSPLFSKEGGETTEGKKRERKRKEKNEKERKQAVKEVQGKSQNKK